MRKATNAFVMYVCPFARVEQLGSYWMDFHEIWCLSTFGTSAEKIHVSLKFDKNNGTLHEDRYMYIYDNISPNYS